MIKVRKLRFDFSDDIPFWFNPRNGEASQIANNLSLMAPAFERYFVKAIREAMPRIRSDAAKEEAQRFCAQEGLHAKFHTDHQSLLLRKHPELEERDGRLFLSEPMAAATRRKIRAILRIAARHDHADLVLSALGCGAFRNPPHHVAGLFRETLEEAEFLGVFRRIVFAIFDDHNAHAPHNPEGNYLPFAREFGGPSPSTW